MSTYPGGKNGSGVYQTIINNIPPHRIYVEPFLGGGAILRMKRPAAVNIAIDINRKVIQSFDPDTTPNLTLLQRDALKWLDKNPYPGDTFIYCDPPYLMSSRSQQRRIYANEFNIANHITLLTILKSQTAMIMLSGYPNALYDGALKGWNTKTFMTTTRGGNYVTEKLWMNYPTPVELHDYSFLGSNFRERERIKRKKKRWISRLLTMRDLERQALAAAIAEMSGTGQHR